MNNFGEKLKELREDNKLTQPQLAKVLGVSNCIISKWENNLMEPKLTYLTRIVKYFNISADYLLGIEENYKISNKINKITINNINID